MVGSELGSGQWPIRPSTVWNIDGSGMGKS